MSSGTPCVERVVRVKELRALAACFDENHVAAGVLRGPARHIVDLATHDEPAVARRAVLRDLGQSEPPDALLRGLAGARWWLGDGGHLGAHR